MAKAADSLPEFSSCPACDSSRIRFELTIHYWREFPLDFFECEDCQACFANPMPSSELITAGNNALVRWYQRGRSFEEEFRDARQAYLRGRMLAQKLKRGQKKGTLLDLGCYNGFLPLGVRDHSGWSVEGLEISRTLSRFINDRLNIRCYEGTLEESSVPEGRYDFILCHDLIEHINQPQRFLRKIIQVLKPGGRIQIITPNVLQDLAFAKRAFQAGMPMTMLLNHILMFSPKALQTALERAGLRVLELYCYDIRHSLKDFGVFGLGKPKSVAPGPSMEHALGLPQQDLLAAWTDGKIAELRTHRKVSRYYGWIRESIPRGMTLHLPARLGIGHEIFALAEKT